MIMALSFLVCFVFLVFLEFCLYIYVLSGLTPIPSRSFSPLSQLNDRTMQLTQELEAARVKLSLNEAALANMQLLTEQIQQGGRNKLCFANVSAFCIFPRFFSFFLIILF